MGVKLVQLTGLRAPLAPRTVAFSIKPMRGCRTHISQPSSLLWHAGKVCADRTIKLRQRPIAGRDYRTFLVEPHTITEATLGIERQPGDDVVAFDVTCGCIPYPFVLTSPGWQTAKGLRARRLDLAGHSQLGFSANIAAWLLADAGWNRPVLPRRLSQGETVMLYDYLDGEVGYHTFHRIKNGLVQFVDGWELPLQTFGVSCWLFRQASESLPADK